MQHFPLGRSGVEIPPLVFGTSSLGNLYRAIPDGTKLAISRAWITESSPPIAIDTAGKYGAGLALEAIGRNLRILGARPEQVVISNKLGWKRVPLRTPEPTFEPGAWANLEHDAEQRISYRGILDCWEQGCELLGDPYRPQLASVHDPDEYLDGAPSPAERRRRFEDILEAYRALGELKQRGDVAAIGIGAKDWRVIREIESTVELDWVMFANSLTIYRHPPELLEFAASLAERGVGVINSALFHAGFLAGGDYFDYRLASPTNEADRAAFAWRERFFTICRAWEIEPAAACIQYGLTVPGVVAVALNTSSPEKIAANVAAVETTLPEAFWAALREEGVITGETPLS